MKKVVVYTVINNFSFEGEAGDFVAARLNDVMQGSMKGNWITVEQKLTHTKYTTVIFTEHIVGFHITEDRDELQT